MVVSLNKSGRGSQATTIRFACAGGNGATLTDDRGALLLHVSGCDGVTVYATAFDGTVKGGAIHVEVEPGVSWVTAVWAS